MITKSLLWMLYGATGYTGRLTVEEAVRRGHKPLLAGRSEARLKALAEQYDLDYVAVSLEDTTGLIAALNRVELVLHDAGPYKFTARPMIEACLATGTHYLDIGGELEIMQYTLSLHEQAAEKGILLMNAVGFDVVPTDCMAVYLAGKIENPTDLEMGLMTSAGGSPGTFKTAVEYWPGGGTIRRDGEIVTVPFMGDVKTMPFVDKQWQVASVGAAELFTCYHSTGIPNIRIYRVLPPGFVRFMQRWFPVIQTLVRLRPLRRLLQWWIGRGVPGPSEQENKEGYSGFYVKVSNDRGESAEAWLHTPEAYYYTALCSVAVVEQVLDGDYKGALTPGQAFGPDFILGIPGTTRYDSLPDG